MILPFTHDGEPGSVTVDLEQVDDPLTIGKHPATQGFPCCTSAVTYPGRGYRAMFGWVQFVRSTDNSSGGADFDMDPFILFEDAPSPYAFFGYRPTLFDAPSRAEQPAYGLARAQLPGAHATGPRTAVRDAADRLLLGLRRRCSGRHHRPAAWRP